MTWAYVSSVIDGLWPSGVSLPGHGLRRRLSDGRPNPAYERLQEHDRATGEHLSERYYHPSTFSGRYDAELRSQFGSVVDEEKYPWGCADSTYNRVRSLLADANGQLRVGRFGGEESGN